MSKPITVTASLRGHQFAATLTLTSALCGNVDIFRDGQQVASSAWDESGFATRPLVIAEEIDDSDDALAALKRAFVNRLMHDETYSTARAALFA